MIANTQSSPSKYVRLGRKYSIIFCQELYVGFSNIGNLSHRTMFSLDSSRLSCEAEAEDRLVFNHLHRAGVKKKLYLGWPRVDSTKLDGPTSFLRILGQTERNRAISEENCGWTQEMGHIRQYVAQTIMVKKRRSFSNVCWDQTRATFSFKNKKKC